jgi:hypothetical protein
LVDHVDFGPTIDVSDYDALAITENIGTFSAIGPIEQYQEVDVTAAVAAVAGTGTVQFRLRAEFEQSQIGQNIALFNDSEDSFGNGQLPELVVTLADDTATVTITINPVNDAPFNTVPGTQTVDENTDLVVSGISVADVDAGAGDLVMTLTVNNGTLTVNDGVAGGLAMGDIIGNETNTVVLTGTLNELNTTLADTNGLTYRGSLDFVGSDTLTVTSNDQGNTGASGPLSDTDTVMITVNDVNNPPEAVDDSYDVDEDDTLIVAAPGVLANDTDADGDPLSASLLTGPSNGAVSLNTDGSFSYSPNNNFSGTDSFIYGISDDPSDPTSAVVTPNAGNGPFADGWIGRNFIGGTNVVLTSLLVGDDSGPPPPDGRERVIRGFVGFDVSAIPSGTTIQKAVLRLSLRQGSANLGNVLIDLVDFGSAINTTDYDATALQENIGAFSAVSPIEQYQEADVTAAVATVAAGGIVQFRLRAEIEQSQIGQNIASYNDAEDSVGNGQIPELVLTLADDTATVTITINPINDGPQNTVPAAQTTIDQAPLVFSAGNGNAISISDVDAGANDVQVTLTASIGTLSLDGAVGLTFTAGDGVDDASVVFTGSIADINVALDGLTFKPATNGTATVQITTNDLGNSGSGGALFDTDAVTVTSITTPVAVNDNYGIDEDNTLTVAASVGLLANDTDDDGDTLSAVVVSNPGNGTLVLNVDGSFV